MFADILLSLYHLLPSHTVGEFHVRGHPLESLSSSTEPYGWRVSCSWTSSGVSIIFYRAIRLASFMFADILLSLYHLLASHTVGEFHVLGHPLESLSSISEP
ncbi:hypothetical protein RRG08_019998 [Elysia crispata]|uniref:Uncharacterized protein n=1 Tax=Elysia crispata TaxID=231223 RepID=A0AAE1BB54_9GAST|nr:hypothetical protein RRG08_019998 [Elysia crispata]